MGLKEEEGIIASEPEKGQKINTGFMKFLTGNDPIEVEDCSKKLNMNINLNLKFYYCAMIFLI